MTETDIAIEVSRTSASKIADVDFSNIPFGKIYSDHMFVADFRNGQWTDCRIEPFGHMGLSPAISALHYGQSVFEGLKAYKSPGSDKVLVFRPDENARRLQNSARRICMPEVPEELFMAALRQLIDLDRAWVPEGENASLYVRPFIFATDEYIGLKPSETYRFLMFTCPVGSYYSEPVKVKVETRYTRAAKGGTGFAKVAGNYAGAMYPARLAQQQGFHQLLWTDGAEHRFVEEAGTMNVLFVIDGKLVSIPPGDSILPGITRKSLLQLARDRGITVEERPVEVAEVVEAIESGRLTEMFGAGTAATVAHIALMHCNGVDYQLPDIAGREISNRLLKKLRGIQKGIEKDRHNWLVKI